jgi:glycosyltransferase involved in cell wall biosynthesis
MYDSSDKLKIFVAAYACEPDLGSEVGVGWHWVLEMSKYFELWVLTRKSNQSSIETWLKDHPEYDNIHFLYFDLPYYLRFWKSKRRGVRTYYNIWQWVSNSIVKKTMIENDIKIFHHLTYGNVLWTVSRYGKKQFFIWGPAGGVETIPSEFSKYYDFKGRVIEWVRRTIVKSLKYNFGFNDRCKNANLILCKTEILKSHIAVKYQDKAILFTDVAVDSFETKIVNKKNNEKIKYIITGNLDPWRGFDLLIEAFAQAVKVNPNIHLKIIGNGLDWNRLQDLIKTKDLGDYIDMLGKVSMEEYYRYMQESDVIMNTSLKEGAVTTSFDSMAMGIPLICIDTTGYTRYFTNDYALVISMQKREALIHSLKEAILKLADKDTRTIMGKQAQEVGKRFTWDARGKEIYTAILEAYTNSAGNSK